MTEKNKKNLVQLQGHSKTRVDSVWQVNEFSLQHCSNALLDCKER